MYNAEGEEVWRRRLDLNGKILEEVYDRNAPTATASVSHSSFKDSTTTARRGWRTIDADTMAPSWVGT